MSMLYSTKTMPKWCTPKFNRWVSPSTSQTPHRECGKFLGSNYHQVFNFEGTNFFVASRTNYLRYFDVVTSQTTVHNFHERIINITPFQITKDDPDYNMAIVTLESGVRLRAIFHLTGVTHFKLPGQVGISYCPGLYDDKNVVYCLQQKHIEVIAPWGEILASKELPGFLQDQNSTCQLRYINEDELEFKWGFDKFIAVFDPKTLNVVKREQYSTNFLDVIDGQVLFQSDYQHLAFRVTPGNDGDVEYIKLEVGGHIKKAELKNNNNYAIVACGNALRFVDLQTAHQDRCVRVSGGVTDWAVSDLHLVVAHGDGLNIFFIE